MIMSHTFKNVARHEKTPVKLTLLSHDKNVVSGGMKRNDIML